MLVPEEVCDALGGGRFATRGDRWRVCRCTFCLLGRACFFFFFNSAMNTRSVVFRIGRQLGESFLLMVSQPIFGGDHMQCCVSQDGFHTARFLLLHVGV